MTPANLGAQAIMSQHDNRHLVLLQHQEEERELLGAFHDLRKHLPKDPHPHIWKNRRRAANPLKVPGEDVIRSIELSLDAAFATGDNGAIEKTAQQCEHFIERLRARGMRRYIAHAEGAGCAKSEGLATHREITEATHALAVAMASGCRHTAQQAMKEVNDVSQSARRWWSVLSRKTASPAARAIR